MPRTGRVEKRQIKADEIFASPLVSKLINKLMKNGKKALAQNIVYQAFDQIKSDNQDPVKLFETALDNITPRMEVRPRRVGGASYMVPLEVRSSRRQSLALTWLVQSARSITAKDIPAEQRPKNKPLIATKLAREIINAAKGEGKAVSKKEEIHRMAEANKAFAHFRW